ncbi:MAG TPA: hypothetical protein VLX08_03055 [Steroidobacteraceae bacterium]|nr:hypothetical protein [Steroidobacteraceae bacterium]
MSVSKPVILTVLAAPALLAVTGAGASPAPLAPGGSVSPIPTYTSTGTPTVNVLLTRERKASPKAASRWGSRSSR